MSTKEVLAHAREVQGLIELAHAAGIPPRRRRRCSPRASISCSKDSTR